MASKKQTKKVGKVMHEYKIGTLKSSSGNKVTDIKQAIAIAMSEAGNDNYPKKRQAKQAIYRKYNKNKRFMEA
jgi:hypothetical protein